MTATLVENIIVGEFVRLKADSKKTYTRGKFNQATRKYELSNFEDINDIKVIIVDDEKPSITDYLKHRLSTSLPNSGPSSLWGVNIHKSKSNTIVDKWSSGYIGPKYDIGLPSGEYSVLSCRIPKTGTYIVNGIERYCEEGELVKLDSTQSISRKSVMKIHTDRIAKQIVEDINISIMNEENNKHINEVSKNSKSTNVYEGYTTTERLPLCQVPRSKDNLFLYLKELIHDIQLTQHISVSQTEYMYDLTMDQYLSTNWLSDVSIDSLDYQLLINTLEINYELTFPDEVTKFNPTKHTTTHDIFNMFYQVLVSNHKITFRDEYSSSQVY